MIHLDRIRISVFHLGFFVLMGGLLLSRAMISIGMVLLIVQALMHPKPLRNIKMFFRNPAYIMLTSVFFLFLVSGLWSENMDYFFSRMQVKLPFLLLPFAYFSAPIISRQTVQRYLAVFVLFITASTFFVLGEFALNYREITENYIHAKVIPTPVNHIRYSLMVAFAALMAGYLYFQKFRFWFKSEPVVYASLGVFLFIFLHVLSVRSGLFSLYFIIGFLIIRFIWMTKNWKLGVPVLGGLILLPVIAYLLVPTFHNKIDYMAKDLRKYFGEKNITYYSDSKRLASWEAGISVAFSAPLIGVGYGDFKQEVHEFYESEYPEIGPEEYIIPHNQFILVFAAIGIIGLVIFSFLLVFPIFHKTNYKYVPLIVINLLILASFMVESSIEAQIGTAFYLMFNLLFLKNQTIESA